MQPQVFVPFLPHLIPPLPDAAIALMLQECILSYIPAPFILCVASALVSEGVLIKKGSGTLPGCGDEGIFPNYSAYLMAIITLKQLVFHKIEFLFLAGL